jgi:hypothetical protein
VEHDGPIEDRLDQLERIGAPQARDDVRVADVEAEADGRGGDPLGHRPQDHWGERECVRGGEERSEVLQRRPLEGLVTVPCPGPGGGGPMEQGAQPGGAERLGERRGMTVGVAGMDESIRRHDGALKVP